MDDNARLLDEINDKILYGEDLIEKLSIISKTDGVPKLQRKIKQELVFLRKLRNSGIVKKEQLSCSNLRHLGSLVEIALRPGAGIVSVSSPMHSSDGGRVNIDLIQDQGKTWIKVIARNPKSLSALCKGNASFGARSVLDQAKDYIECAKLHPCFYQTPQVVFEFVSGIEDVLAAKLQEMGVCVKGTILPTEGEFRNYSSSADEEGDSSNEDNGSSEEEDENNMELQNADALYTHSNTDFNPEGQTMETLNLDVTTMMAYISNLTNGHYNFVYKQPLLSQQAVWEAKRPVKPILDEIFKGKNLVCCEAAWGDLTKIVDVLGGPNEKRRAAELRETLTVMPDNINGPDDPKRAALNVRGRVRLRSKIVFNFGQRIKAVTVSANEGFVRAAKQQGVTYATIIHESRALTEQKEATAQYCQLPTVIHESENI